ncbi:hypothetical protein, partial [Enterococcus faecium]
NRFPPSGVQQHTNSHQEYSPEALHTVLMDPHCVNRATHPHHSSSNRNKRNSQTQRVASGQYRASGR